MAYFRTCPYCGANLDPGEICTCRQKDGAALLEQDDPKGTRTANIISSMTQNVNALTALRSFLSDNGIPIRDAIAVLSDAFPSFDKTVMSKCLKPEKYGVVLHPNGWVYLNDAYPDAIFSDSPSATAAKKKERRRLPCRIYGRLSQSDFAKLQQYASEDGYLTIQNWLHAQVTAYLNTKEADNAGHS